MSYVIMLKGSAGKNVFILPLIAWLRSVPAVLILALLRSVFPGLLSGDEDPQGKPRKLEVL